MAKKATITDVARLANVSKSTVSKYLNNTPYVSEKTKEKIRKAIEELDYSPNTFARGLVNKSTKLIALVLSRIEMLNNYLLLTSIEEESNKYGFDIVFVTTRNDEQVEQSINKILSERYKHVDGIILANIRDNGINLEELKRKFENIVLVHRHIPNDIVDYVTIDNYLGGKIVADYFLRMGHKSFAAISGPSEILPYRERIKGFTETLIKNGFQDSYSIIEGGQDLEAGYKAAEKIMLGDDPPTAVFATSDLLALGFLDASKDYGWNIPNEVSLTGFDNVYVSRLARVPLTTVDGQFEDLGKKSVQLLVERMADKNKDLTQIFLQPSLIVRGSCSNLNEE